MSNKTTLSELKHDWRMVMDADSELSAAVSRAQQNFKDRYHVVQYAALWLQNVLWMTKEKNAEREKDAEQFSEELISVLKTARWFLFFAPWLIFRINKLIK